MTQLVQKVSADGIHLPKELMEAEIEEAIRAAPWQPARFGRMQCQKDFTFNGVWHG